MQTQAKPTKGLRRKCTWDGCRARRENDLWCGFHIAEMAAYKAAHPHVPKNQSAKVGDWLTEANPGVYGTTYRSGRITKIENGVATIFNAEGWDGMGTYDEIELDNPFVEVK